MKIRTGDTLVVISGTRKNKGKVGKVLKVFPQTSRVVVEGVNIATRHYKKQGTQAGQIVKMEKSIDASNVMLQCPITQKPTTKKVLLSSVARFTKKLSKTCVNPLS